MKMKDFAKKSSSSLLLNLAVLDFLVIAVAVITTYCLSATALPGGFLAHFAHYTVITVFYWLCLVVSLAAAGLYNRLLLAKKRERTARLLLAVAATALVTTQISYLLPALQVARLAWATIFLITFFLLSLQKALVIHFLDDTLFKKRVLVLGAGRKALQFSKVIAAGTESTTVVGYVHQPGERELLDKAKVLYSISSICQYALENAIEEIVVAVDDRRNGFPLQQLLAARLQGIDVTDLLHFYERELGQMKLDILDPSWLIFSHSSKERIFQQRAKRALDLVLAVTALCCAAPLLLLIAFFLLLQNGKTKGVLKRTATVGKGGTVFQRYALQIEDNAGFASRWLVGLGIKEWPQLFNVLEGSMSLIGPPAINEALAAAAIKEIPYYNERNMVMPGMVAWGQVAAVDQLSADNLLEQLQFDLYYVKNQGVFLDFVVLIHALSASFSKQDSSLFAKTLASSGQ